MITAYLDLIEPLKITSANQDLCKDAIWIDIFCPSKTEEELIKQCLNLTLPMRAKMGAIELSSRLYQDNDFHFMTLTTIAQSDLFSLKLDPVTCILTQKQLITVRYVEPQFLKLFISQLKKQNTSLCDSITLFIELLEANVDCLADLLELTGHHLDEHSKTIFHTPSADITTKLDYRKLMQQIGTDGDLNAKVRESLMSLSRLIPFFEQSTSSRLDHEKQLRLSIVDKDIVALSDQALFISNNTVFLLDAILGMVTVEQNNIIRILSVAAVIFLPPTIIASIYGMNLRIPGVSWKFEYIFVLFLIALSSWLPYQYFKYRKWL